MKRRKLAGYLALSCLCSAMLSAGCTLQNNNNHVLPSEGQIVIPNGQGNNGDKKGTDSWKFPLEYGKQVPAYYESSDVEVQKKNLSAQAAGRIRSFASESSAEIFPEVQGNYLYSPASLYMALELCGSLTYEDSASDLMELLGVKDREELLAQGNTLIRTLSSDEEGNLLKIGNSAWIDRDWIPAISQAGYEKLDKSAAALGTDIYREILLEQSTRDKINSWISDRTNGLIKEMPVEPEKDTAMILFNTLYFDKHWARTIKENEVVKAEFYPAGTDSAVEIDRIEYSMESHPFVKTEHAVSSAAMYQDGSYIIFIKPASDQALEAAMTEDLSEVINAYARHSFTQPEDRWVVQFGIPLVDYETKIEDLDKVISKMGVSSVFQAGTFSDIGPELYVSNIAQDCRIIVDREGTKAAAVTEMTLAGAILMEEPEIIDMRLDHEYGYVIMSKDDIPLFIGAVRDPG